MSTEAKVSFYNSAKDVAPSKEITIRELVRMIHDEDMAQGVAHVRKSATEDAKRNAKMRLPAVQISGNVTDGNRAKAIQENRFVHSGFIQLDVDDDGLNGKTPQEARSLLGDDKHVLSAFITPSGEGAKALFKIRPCLTDEDHKQAFRHVEKYILTTYGLKIDPATKDPGRLCFLSADKDCTWNGSTEEFIPPVEEPTMDLPPAIESPPATDRQEPGDFTLTGTAEDVRHILSFIPPRPAYDEWLRISSAVWDALGGVDGTSALQAWSPGEDAEEYANKYPQRLKDVKAGSLVAIAREHGYNSKAHAARIHERTNPRWNGKVKIRTPQASDTKGDSKEVVDIYGPPVFTDMQNKTQVITDINEAYWAGLYAHENIVLHEPAERKFYKYNSETGLYSPETSDRIKHDISARLLQQSLIQGMGKLIEFRRDAKLNSVVATLRGITEEGGAFDNRPQTVHLENCVLRFTPVGFEKLEFSPSFKSRNQSPIAYDPAAKCPRFLNELILPAVHPEDVLLLQKMIGQALLGRNLVQRFVILDGLGGRGKTQLANVIQMIVGQANSTQLRTHLLNERFEIYRFLHRTLLTGIDVPADFLSTKGAQVIKALVGGDWMDAEQKGGTGSFQLKGDFNIFITANKRLKIGLAGDITAWRRRLLIVKYEAPPPKKKIPEFAEMLVSEEGSGILNWALDGLRAIMADIEVHGDITLTDRQNGVVDSLLAESESLRHFLETRVECAPGRNLTVDEIIETYADFCPTMGWNPQPITEIQRDLPSLMLDLFRTVRAQDIQREGKSRRGFRNVAFTGESEI